MAPPFLRPLLPWVAALLSCGACFAQLAPESRSAPLAAPTPVADGPYVWPHDGGWVERHFDGGVAREGAVKGAALTIGSVGNLPAFVVALRAPASKAPEMIPAPRTPLFVLADTHGEYEIVVEMLQRQGVVDSQLKWSFGKGSLVVLGDVFDRGPHHLEILWLLYKLEAEATAAGGALHLVLGNHETMVLTGDLRYLNPRHRPTARVLGRATYADLLDAQSVLGQWLRAKPALFKAGRMLFLHAGLSKALVDSGMTLPEINGIVTQVLATGLAAHPDPAKATLVMKTLGPLWYRGYFPEHKDFPQASQADVDASLARFGVCRIFVGHTIVPTVQALYDGKVIAVQVYPNRDPVSKLPVLEAVVVEGGRVLRAKIDGTREPLPAAARACS